MSGDYLHVDYPDDLNHRAYVLLRMDRILSASTAPVPVITCEINVIQPKPDPVTYILNAGAEQAGWTLNALNGVNGRAHLSQDEKRRRKKLKALAKASRKRNR